MSEYVLTLSICVAATLCAVAWLKYRQRRMGTCLYVSGFVVLIIGFSLSDSAQDDEQFTEIRNRRSTAESSVTDPGDVPDSPDVTVRDQRDDDSLTVPVSLNRLEDHRPIQVDSDGYVGSDACIECHQDNHQSWFASYHRSMTQIAKPEIILGDFDSATVKHGAREYLLTQEGDTCMVEMPEEYDPRKRVKAPIVMTTGSHHMQIYWFATGNKRNIGMLPLVHLNETGEWIPRYSAFLGLEPPPTFEMARWNKSCSNCHSTHRQGRPRDDGLWDTQVGEFGISCEACHGPGEPHIEFHRRGGSTPESTALTASDPIVNPISLSKVRSAQVCGQCHAVRNVLIEDETYHEKGHAYRPGNDLTVTHGVWQRDSPEYGRSWKHLGYPDADTFLDESFYRDGMIRVSGREYNGLLRSSCYINGEMTCLTCHKMHKAESDSRTLQQWANDQLSPEALGDSTCLQCHSDSDYGESHTHHAPTSTGSRCYNCHMPHTTYGLLKAIRSHQISSPDIGADDAVKRPNACNLCHLDKTLAWSASHLETWYGIEPPELDADKQAVAASLVWLLRGDAAERAISAWALGWDQAQAASGTDWQAPFLASLLDDNYSAIRLIARRSLRTLPGWEDFALDVVTSSTSQQRQSAALDVIRSWTDATSDSRRTRPHLLIEASGGVRVDRVKDLLDRQDRTEILLSE